MYAVYAGKPGLVIIVPIIGTADAKLANDGITYTLAALPTIQAAVETNLDGPIVIFGLFATTTFRPFVV